MRFYNINLSIKLQQIMDHQLYQFIAIFITIREKNRITLTNSSQV